ncbi:hypothetical protein NUU61_008953 [Penicillium alfredii]|uniref:Only prolin and serin are matching in the corresponding protein n=1 Tax=Penicillium alfredii TaxID=1506179 RepID=A0A9W9JWG2_9EURO|nr:uncharacterized protein NUU61_008953 [Penicillium alfredii]KAJ5084374.1 hypothetical protein NUU61_008953 [Penicillium alfredii]
MFKRSHPIDTRDSIEGDSPASRQQSPLTINTSAPASPALSLFSATGHNRVSSSVSSLVSSSGLGNSMDSPSRNHLTGVKEEPLGRDSLEDQYFQHFDHGVPADEPYFSDTPDNYDLSDTGVEFPHSQKKRRSDSVSMKGVSRISSHISTMSTRWKPKRSSGLTEDGYPEDLRSRANSAASSALASPVVSPECASESSARPIDITRANSLSQDDNDLPQATTPLLPPFMGDDPTSAVASRVQSPLQSPSVADVTDVAQDPIPSDHRFVGIPSPPLSSKPSVASFGRTRANTVRTVSSEAPPFILSDPNDEWANKLGHANFTIQPEPYVPAMCDIECLQQLRANWDLARCNFAKHLVRTGEHYGVTSNIYKLTGEKWETINREWRYQHDAMLSQLGMALTLTQSDIHPCEQVRVPRLHDNDKFPEMGDEDIVGPMTVAPATVIAGPCRTKSVKKRNFLRFFQDLVGRP